MMLGARRRLRLRWERRMQWLSWVTLMAWALVVGLLVGRLLLYSAGP